jgi:hypothetical protein
MTCNSGQPWPPFRRRLQLRMVGAGFSSILTSSQLRSAPRRQRAGGPDRFPIVDMSRWGKGATGPRRRHRYLPDRRSWLVRVRPWDTAFSGSRGTIRTSRYSDARINKEVLPSGLRSARAPNHAAPGYRRPRSICVGLAYYGCPTG